MPQPPRSPVWRFFDKLGNSCKAKCKFCGNEVSCGKTSAMINHKKRKKKVPTEPESSKPPPPSQDYYLIG